MTDYEIDDEFCLECGDGFGPNDEPGRLLCRLCEADAEEDDL